jgi:hypothetical protein
MRTSLYLIGFATASIVGAGAVGFGCSSSSSPSTSTTTPDAAMEAAAAPDSSTTDASEDAADAAAEACTSSVGTVLVDEIDASAFSCFLAQCTASLTACAADCDCNNVIVTALNCQNTMGAAAQVTCFGPVISDTNPTTIAAFGCLMTNSTGACAPPAGDGGTSDAGDSSTTITDSSTVSDAADAAHD